MEERGNNQTTLKDALKAMLDHYKLKGKLNQSRIRHQWEEMMGPSIANYTKDIKLYKGKLFIIIDSAPLRQELSYGKEKIRKVLNEQLGEEAIREVIIR
jgi:predicted nucleic acid-binding Zn ribbon protein